MIYDFAIIGGGAAGLNLALCFARNPFYKEKQIIIVDREAKDENDKTWCYWEDKKGHYDQIISHSWDRGLFYADRNPIQLDLTPFSYKMLPALSFYDFAKKQLSHHENISWVMDDIGNIENQDVKRLVGSNGSYEAKMVFDSRIEPAFYTSDDSIKILQHFKGWFIKTEKPVFQPNEFVMMDYRLKWETDTSFTYVLPVSETEALVEFTLFTPSLITDEDYNRLLKQYIETFITEQYDIIKVEQGVIPMSNYPFHKGHQNGIYKIGTAGGWVKPSSGYSFRNSIAFAERITQNIVEGTPPTTGILSSRHRYYDTLILDILNHKNHLGPDIFHQMYSRVSIQQIFRFLDEETSLLEDIKIISSFDPGNFLQAIGRQLRSKARLPI